MSAQNDKYILYGPKLKYNETRGIGELIFEAMHKYSDKICQVDASNGNEETFANFHKRSVQLAVSMRELGIRHGDIVCICSFNNMDVGVTYVAASYLNAVLTFLDPTLSMKTTANLLNIVKPKLIFCEEKAVELIESASKEIDLHSKVIVYDYVDTNHKKFAELLQNRNNEHSFRPEQIYHMNELHAVMFSSGTTGDPKGIKIPHCMLLHGIRRTPNDLCPDTILHFATFYWITSAHLFLKALLSGSKRIVVSKFDPKTALQVLHDYKVNFTLMATSFISLLKPYHHDTLDFNNLRCLIVGGAKCSEQQARMAKEMFPHACILLSWGMTECGEITYFDPKIHQHLIDSKLTSSGKLCPGISGKVVNLDTNLPVGPGVLGEWRLKCDYFTTGYYDKSVSDLWDEDGFLKTGDVGYYDEDECVYLIDRIKDLIKYRGYHVSPISIEEIILKHPKVEQTVVFGIPNEVDQDHCAAYVVLKEDAENVKSQDIVDFVNRRVEDREKLRGGVKLVKEIPKNSSGKILRHELRKLYISDETY